MYKAMRRIVKLLKTSSDSAVCNIPGLLFLVIEPVQCTDMPFHDQVGLVGERLIRI